MYGIAKALRRSEELLRAVHLADKRDAYSRTLSGGMKRRLLIAKAMVHSPPILVLDEPTAGVDVELRRQLWELVGELNAEGVTVVLTTHYLEEAEQLCDRIAIINHGELIANQPTRELVGMAREKIVRVTVDKDLAGPPMEPAFVKAEVLEPRTLEITYDRDAVERRPGARAGPAARLRDRGRHHARGRPRGRVRAADQRREEPAETSPFVLSLSKDRFSSGRAHSERPFDRLRANGWGG